MKQTGRNVHSHKTIIEDLIKAIKKKKRAK